MRAKKCTSIAAFLLLVAACGGSGGGSGPPPTSANTPAPSGAPTTQVTSAPTTSTAPARPLTEPAELSLVIVNATTRNGVAGLTAQRLAGAGYTTSRLESMQNQEATVVFHTTDLASEAAVLSELLGTGATEATSAVDDGDIRIVLGRSYEALFPPEPPLLLAQLAAWSGGGGPGPCDVEDFIPTPTLPYFGPDGGSKQIRSGSIVSICAVGFDEGAPIDVTMAAAALGDVSLLFEPDRDPLADVLASGILGDSWWVGSSFPLGRYRIRATQGSRTSSWTLDVVAPEAPFIRVVEFRQTRRFVIGGFEPGIAKLGVYRNTNEFVPPSQCQDCFRFELIMELPLVWVDGSGMAIVKEPDDLPRGEYCVTGPQIPGWNGEQTECEGGGGGSFGT